MAFSFQGRPSDVVLFVMGASGAGKSTLINHVFESVSRPSSVRCAVHSRLDRCTSEIQAIRLMPSNNPREEALGQVVLVDGPGFDDSGPEQRDSIIAAAKNWLGTCYTSTANYTCGVIHVHDISVTPLDSVSNFENLQSSIRMANFLRCGSFSVVTTKWGKLVPDVSSAAEEQMKRTWKWITDAGIPIQTIKPGEEKTDALVTIQYFLNRPYLDVERLGQNLQKLLPPYSPDPIIDGCEADLVTVVVGQTKSGKSSFLNQLVGSNRFQVGPRLAPCTSGISWHVVPQIPEGYGELSEILNGRRIVLVDTPGFDDTAMEDAKLLSRVSEWLAKSYGSRMRVVGIVYLHDISRDDSPRSLLGSIPLISNLCGSRGDAIDLFALVTTKWDRLETDEEGNRRVGELREDVWADVILRGAQAYHLRASVRGDGPSPGVVRPWDIIHRLAASANAPNIQNKLHERQGDLINATAVPPGSGAEWLHTSSSTLKKAAKGPGRRAKRAPWAVGGR